MQDHFQNPFHSGFRTVRVIKNFPQGCIKMTLIHHLRPGTVLLKPDIADKWDLIERMVDAFVSSGSLPSSQRSATLAALIARERSLSTGMEDGIAVPHAALDGLESMASGIATLPDGIDFQSLDGNPTRIVVTLVVLLIMGNL